MVKCELDGKTSLQRFNLQREKLDKEYGEPNAGYLRHKDLLDSDRAAVKKKRKTSRFGSKLNEPVIAI